jgi:hypothetical protein
MKPKRVAKFTDRVIGIIREQINDEKFIMKTCKKCNSRGPHKFVKIKPRLGVLHAIGKKIYRCKNCGARMDEKGQAYEEAFQKTGKSLDE